MNKKEIAIQYSPYMKKNCKKVFNLNQKISQLQKERDLEISKACKNTGIEYPAYERVYRELAGSFPK